MVQLRIGGQAARHVDETLPVGYGCLGQETIGAGGLAKALRTVPVVLELAEEMAARANPGAWLVDFTNPVGIVTQALLDEGHRAVGLCNVAIWAQRRLGHYLGVDPDDVAVEHVGLNHLTWIRSARVGGASGAGPTRRCRGTGPAGRIGSTSSSSASVRSSSSRAACPSTCSACSTRCPRTTCTTTTSTTPRWRSRRHRATAHGPTSWRSSRPSCSRSTGIPRSSSKPAALSYRGGAFYSLAAVRLMASLHAGTGDIQVVDMRNDGAVPGLPDDAVVETTAVVDANGAHPLPQRPLPPDMLGLVQHAKAYERLAVRAACSGSREDVVRALLANPLVGQYPLAAELADELLAANKDHLPRFFPS